MACFRKVSLIALMFVLALGTMAFAESTGNPTWTTPIDPLNVFLDENATHTHGYEMYKPKTELGLMADVTMYEDIAMGIPYALGVQSQYDFNNKNWGFYGKVSLNFSPMVKKLIGK